MFEAELQAQVQRADELVTTPATVAQDVIDNPLSGIADAGLVALMSLSLPRFALLPAFLVLPIEPCDFFGRKQQVRGKIGAAGFAFGDAPIEDVKSASWTAILHLGPISFGHSVPERESRV